MTTSDAITIVQDIQQRLDTPEVSKTTIAAAVWQLAKIVEDMLRRERQERPRESPRRRMVLSNPPLVVGVKDAADGRN